MSPWHETAMHANTASMCCYSRWAEPTKWLKNRANVAYSEDNSTIQKWGEKRICKVIGWNRDSFWSFSGWMTWRYRTLINWNVIKFLLGIRISIDKKSLHIMEKLMILFFYHNCSLTIQSPSRAINLKKNTIMFTLYKAKDQLSISIKDKD